MSENTLEYLKDGKSLRFHGCSNIKNYVLMSKLGEGTFGEVYKAESRITGQTLAMKKILMHQEKDGFPVTALREIRLLKMLSHPNVLKLEEMAMERVKGDGRRKATVYMVTPYMDHDLSGLLENPCVEFSESHIKCYMLQLLEGVAYLHAKKILHRDMKAANLLINNAGILQIADFGLARLYDDPPPQTGRGNGEATRGYTTVVVTRWYRPPELLMQLRTYTPAIDIWGVGCVLGEMFRKRPILTGSSDLNQLQLIFDLMGSPNEINMPGWNDLPGCEGVKTFQHRKSSIGNAFRKEGSVFISLLSELLKLDWRKRINAIDALKHPYFTTDPMPAKPGNIPSFPESHELDRRLFREQKANLPPAPAGGTVGAGSNADIVTDTMFRDRMHRGERSREVQPEKASQRTQQSSHERQAPMRDRGQRSTDQPRITASDTARETVKDRVPNGLPPRPPVETPRGAPPYRDNRVSYGGRERHVNDNRRDRHDPYGSAARFRAAGSTATDTYIPTYNGRAEERSGHEIRSLRLEEKRREDNIRPRDRN